MLDSFMTMFRKEDQTPKLTSDLEIAQEQIKSLNSKLAEVEFKNRNLNKAN